MILIDDCKYSCMECIRGHRSSLCRHHFRPLLQVRSKGRPNVNTTGNPNHRIAVFAEEIEDDVAEMNCKRNPVVILKASPKQIIDLDSGQIVGPYKETDHAPDSSRPPAPIINSDSFINTSLCCSGNAIAKKDKSCGCCTNKTKKNINKQKILKTYLKKRMDNSIEAKLAIKQDQIKQDQVKKEPLKQEPHVKQEPHTVQLAENHTDSKVLYDIVSVPSCSIPGSCCCDDNCSCKGCMVHGNSPLPTNEANKMFPNYFEQSYLDQYLPNEDNIVFNTFGYNQVNRKEPDVANGSEQSTANFFAGLLEQNQPVGMSSGPSEDTNSPSGLCVCAASECDCYNCETHGIINGCKLEELFLTTENNKLMSVINDYQNIQPANHTNHNTHPINHNPPIVPQSSIHYNNLHMDLINVMQPSNLVPPGMLAMPDFPKLESQSPKSCCSKK